MSVLSLINGFLSLYSAFLSRLSGFFGDKNGSQRRIIIISWFSTIPRPGGAANLLPTSESGRTITPDQARREALSLRDPARQELQSGIDAATRTLNAGLADSATLKELRGLRGELKALESDTQVGAVLRHIDQAQKAGIEKLTVLLGRDGSARDAIYAIGRAAVRSLDLQDDQRAGHGMSAEQTQSPASWFNRASQKLSASEETPPQSNSPKSRGPQFG